MFAKTILLVFAAAGAATAQVQNYTSSLDMTIDPNQVSAQDRGKSASPGALLTTSSTASVLT